VSGFSSMFRPLLKLFPRTELLQRFQLAVWPDVGGRWRNVDRWPNAEESRVARFRLPHHHAFDG
jgi:hypothetical protein